MAKHTELLLLESIENLGIVGDVVRVKNGYARNFLLPMGVAERPTPAKIESLKEARARAEAEQQAQRKSREALIERLEGVSVTMERSCNDQGALYGSVTQRDISDALIEAGYGVDVKSIRLSHPIRRVGPYHVVVQFAKDLKAEVDVVIEPDHELEQEREEEEGAKDADRPRDDRPMFGVDAITGEVTGERPRRPRREGKGKGKGRRPRDE